MSIPIAYPVFRTTDPVLALRVARLGSQGDQHVGLAGAGFADQAERLTLLDPLTAGERSDGGRRHPGRGPGGPG